MSFIYSVTAANIEFMLAAYSICVTFPSLKSPTTPTDWSSLYQRAKLAADLSGAMLSPSV